MFAKFKNVWNMVLTGRRKLQRECKDMWTYREKKKKARDKMEQSRVRSRKIFAFLLHFVVVNPTSRKLLYYNKISLLEFEMLFVFSFY